MTEAPQTARTKARHVSFNIPSPFCEVLPTLSYYRMCFTSVTRGGGLAPPSGSWVAKSSTKGRSQTRCPLTPERRTEVSFVMPYGSSTLIRDPPPFKGSPTDKGGLF